MSRLLSRKSRQASNPVSFSAALECLEGRRLLSTSVWTGAGGNHLFSNGANWQSGVAPASGDDIVFSDLGSAQTVDIDTSAIVGNIYGAGNYTVTDNELGISGNVEAEPNSSLTFTDAIEPSTSNHFTSDSGATLTLGLIDDSNASTYDEYGDGTLVIAGNTYANWQLLAGTMNLNAATSMNLTQYAGTVLPTASTGSTVNTFTQDGGVVDLTTPGNNSGHVSLTASNAMTLNSGTVISSIDSSGNNSYLLTNNGVALHVSSGEQFELQLASNFVPAPGTTYYPVYSGDGNGPTGSFSNLTVGNDFDDVGSRFSTSVQSGYLALTVVGEIPNLTVSPSSTSTTPGTPVTLTANFTGYFASPNGTVTFSDNGNVLGTASITTSMSSPANATFTVPSFAVGSHSIVATYGGDLNYVPGASSAVTVVSTATTTPPVLTGPSITTLPTSVAATSTSSRLSVGALDTTPTLTTGVTYTWTVIRKPSGAKTPSFSVNGTHAAATTMASFSKDGTYHFRVTATDANGHSASSDVDFTVAQSAKSLRLSPHAFKLASGKSTQLKTVVLDQFGHSMRVVGTPMYVVTAGSGAVSSTGLFTAGSVFGHVVIKSTIDDLTGTIGATVV